MLIWLLILVCLGALLVRLSDKWTTIFFGFKPTSGISVLSEPQGAVVFINGKEVGKTPYESKDLEVGEYTIKLNKEDAFWQGKVALTAGTVAVINRDLVVDQASSAGEILTLEKGKGLTVISNPTAADIEVDGKPYDKTPINVNIAPGEHTILVSHPNYLKRSIRASLPANFNLTVAVDLALSDADLTAIQTPVVNQTIEVIVTNTPTGYLRVREKPTTTSNEIARVKPGDTLVFLEEQGSWDRVRLPNNTEGFVSAAFVEKKAPN